MGIHAFASRYTRKSLVTGDLSLTVLSGQSIQICGIVFDNTTGTSIKATISHDSIVNLKPYLIVPPNADVRLRAAAGANGRDVSGYIQGVLLK